MHYSLSTEKTYLYWVNFFIHWHGRSGVMRHLREVAGLWIGAFLTMLATQREGICLYAQSGFECRGKRCKPLGQGAG
jgi:hypothetical protein